MAQIIGFGEVLKKKREEKNISIKDVSSVTKLNTSIIYALEEEDLSHLPSPVYVINFIKLYAAFLGLDYKILETMYLNHQNIDKEKFYYGEPTKNDKKSLNTARIKIFYYFALFAIISIFVIYLWENFDLGNRILIRKRRKFGTNITYEITAPLDVEVIKSTKLSIFNRGVKIFDDKLLEKNTYYFNLIYGYRMKIERPENIFFYFKKKQIVLNKNIRNAEFIVTRKFTGELQLKLTDKNNQ